MYRHSLQGSGITAEKEARRTQQSEEGEVAITSKIKTFISEGNSQTQDVLKGNKTFHTAGKLVQTRDAPKKGETFYPAGNSLNSGSKPLKDFSKSLKLTRYTLGPTFSSMKQSFKQA